MYRHGIQSFHPNYKRYVMAKAIETTANIIYIMPVKLTIKRKGSTIITAYVIVFACHMHVLRKSNLNNFQTILDSSLIICFDIITFFPLIRCTVIASK